MSYEIRADYGQAYLLPPSIDDWVGRDHPARFVGDFVDSLDLLGLGFSVRESVDGRPNFSSDLLLKVWLYGWMEGVRSPRAQEKACLNHMGFIWLTGNHGPDHVTLWRFHNKHRPALVRLFRQTVLIAKGAGLVDMALHALDGTKIKVASSAQQACLASAEAALLEGKLEELDAAIAAMMDAMESQYSECASEYRLPESLQDAHARKARIQALYDEVVSLRPSQAVLPAEPEARKMKTRDGVRWAYNAQAVVDAHSQIIVAQDVVPDGNDNGLLVPMIEEVARTVGEAALETVADAGYYAGEQLTAAERAGHNVLVAPPSQEKQHTNPYHAVHFRYDEDKDCFICPQNKELPYMTTGPRGHKNEPKRIYRCTCYRDCPVRAQCSSAKNGRTVVLDPHREAVQRQRAKRNDEKSRKNMARRRTIVEPVFGWIKDRLGLRRWTVKGLDATKSEWTMACITINIKKIYQHWHKHPYLPLGVVPQ